MSDLINQYQQEKHDPVLCKLLQVFFEKLGSSGIRYCVLRNYAEFPNLRSAYSDIDILIEADKESDAIRLLKDCIKRANLALYLHYRHSGTAFFIGSTNGPSLHIDIFVGLSWKQVSFLDAKTILNEAVPHGTIYKPRSGHEAAISLLSYLLYRGKVKTEYLNQIVRLTDMDLSGFIALLAPAWGSQQAERLGRLVCTRQWEAIVDWASEAKRAMVRKAWLNAPIAMLGKTAMQAAFIIRRILNPPGLVIVLVGTDGSGKTTVGTGLHAALGSIFSIEKTRRFHWRPGLLPAPTQLVRRWKRGAKVVVSADPTRPHGLPPYSCKVSLVRFFYFWIDFVAGSLLRFRPLVARNSLVLVDRYYYDFLIDPLRYRLDLPSWIVRLGACFVPQPDLVFFLDAPADVILGRKQELPCEELQRQREAIGSALSACGVGMHTIDTTRGVQAAISDIRTAVFTHLSERERRRSVIYE